MTGGERLVVFGENMYSLGGTGCQMMILDVADKFGCSVHIELGDVLERLR